MCTSSGKQPPIKFHTAGGKSISVSNDALQCARSLLGDPDLRDFFDGGDVVTRSFLYRIRNRPALAYIYI
ncbi:hypothetical protein Lal_00030269 [Lupinus albus]|nr:hypothetical protein Lal_00030269 [Lupinus albus]